MPLAKRNRLEATVAGVMLAIAAISVFGMGGVATRATPLSASRRALRPRLTELAHARAAASPRPQGEDLDPPEVQVGLRLFLETRFAQYFAAHMTGVNAAPVFVGSDDGEFGEHDQDFVFGADELKGLKIFLREPLPQTLAGDPRYLSTRTGNCIACHAAPNFTDFSFHNTGATKEEFDAANGDGAFARLFIPDLDYRSAHHDAFLPATPQHPGASGLFRTAPGDLGLWNVFANPDFPAPQQALTALINAEARSPSDALRRVIGFFKTPGLRDLGQSGPYLHTGRKRELEEVLDFYVSSANRQREGRLRNGSEELGGIFLSDGDLDPLAAFLRSLNEDYN